MIRDSEEALKGWETKLNSLFFFILYSVELVLSLKVTILIKLKDLSSNEITVTIFGLYIKFNHYETN